MAYVSAHQQAREIEAEIKQIMILVDMFEADKTTRALSYQLRRDMTDARLEIRDYELAETRVDQMAVGKGARKRLMAVRDGILLASMHNIFSPVDVAQLTARLELLSEAIE